MQLILDFETRSTLDVRDVGAYRYAMEPSTEVLCYAWKLNGQDIEIDFDPNAPPFELGVALEDDSVEIHAHNASFERLIIQHICGPRYGWPVPRRDRYRCSACRVGRLAIPRNLEAAAKALRIHVQKDMEGQKVMRRMTKPLRRKHAANGWVWDDKPSNLQRLGEYCKTDVLAEEAIIQNTFDLPPTELNYYLLVERMNDRGVQVDIDLVNNLLWQALAVLDDLNDELYRITNRQVRKLTNVADLKKWIYQETNTVLDSLDKEHMEQIDARLFEAFPHVARALEIRRLGGKSSVAKLRAILDHVCADGVLRGAFVSNATSTGRLISIGVQLQNLPRETLKDYENRIQDISSLTIPEISTAIRGVFIPRTWEHVFVDADFNAIEARGVAWLASAKALLKSFRNNGDPYCEIASVIYNRRVSAEHDPDERWVGKQTVLGCGYGMGAQKFQDQCKRLGRAVSFALAEKAIKSYREENPEIPRLWYGLEKAAIKAVVRPGTVTEFQGIAFKVQSKYLQMRLPSGRRLYYRAPLLNKSIKPWGDEGWELTYLAAHPITRQWQRESTWGGKLVENAVQALARDLLMAAQLRLERQGIPIVLSVHDEVVVECLRSEAPEVLRIVQAEMEAGEEWAPGFPIVAKPTIIERFGK